MKNFDFQDCRRPGAAKGFTLVEVLVVVAIMALLLGIAGSMLGRSDAGLATKTAARDLRGAVETAQARAMTTGNEAAVLVANDAADLESYMRFVLVVERVDVNEEGSGGRWEAVGNGFNLPPGTFYYSRVSHSADFDADGATFSPFPGNSPLAPLNAASKWIGLTFNAQGQPVLRGPDRSNPFMVVATGEIGTRGLDPTQDDKYRSEGFMIQRSNGRVVPLESAYDQRVASTDP